MNIDYEARVTSSMNNSLVCVGTLPIDLLLVIMYQIISSPGAVWVITAELATINVTDTAKFSVCKS